MFSVTKKGSTTRKRPVNAVQKPAIAAKKKPAIAAKKKPANAAKKKPANAAKKKPAIAAKKKPTIAATEIKSKSNVYYSQAGQDEAVCKFFHNLTNGYFVEVGAYDGKTHSNTYYLETQLNWKGICIEPNVEQFRKLTKLRKKSICTNCAVFSKDGLKLKFTSAGRKSGLRGYLDRHKNLVLRNQKNTVLVSTLTLTTILQRARAPRYIHYLSIDTEGSELEVLKGIDFSTYSFGFITLEHNHIEPRRTQMKTFLQAKGYTWFGEHRVDDYYIGPPVSPLPPTTKD
jgi:FkbM family methyltransferase